MKVLVKNNLLILVLYLILISVFLFFILSYNKVDIHIYLNQFVGNVLFDRFFYYITYLGDGRMAGILLLIILIYNVRLGICSAVSFFTATIIASVLKHCFFDDVNRPWFIFQWVVKVPMKYVDKEDLYLHNSFPSGHATQIFAIFICLAFFTPKPLNKFLFLSIAVLTAFSRVYLSQHWLVDITAGSLIGICCAFLFYYIFISKNNFNKLNNSLIKLIKSGQSS